MPVTELDPELIRSDASSGAAKKVPDAIDLIIGKLNEVIGDVSANLVNVRDYGAVGDGVTDDTAAIVAAIAAANSVAGSLVLGGAVYFPAGKYNVTSSIAIPSYTTLRGDSRYTTLVQFNSASGRLFDCSAAYGCGFQDLAVQLPLVSSPATVTAFYLSGSFRCTFHRIIVSGNHSVSTPDPQSTGFEFRSNAGDNRIMDCDINALGAGIRVNSIMNHVIGSVFGTNKYSIYGDGGVGELGSGMIVQSCTFVGTGATGGTQAHIICDQGGNIWRVIGCWLEGSRIGIQIGSASGGPQEFGIIGCQIAAVDTAIDCHACPLPYLANITFGADNTGTPTGSHNDLLINATGAPNGFAAGMRRSDSFDFDPASFPSGWTLMRRGAMRLPTLIDVPLAQSFQGIAGTTFETTTDVTPATFKKGAGNTQNLIEVYKNGVLFSYIDPFGGFFAATVVGNSYVQTGTGTTRWYTGTGSPEGAVTASVGSIYSQSDGSAGTMLWAKSSGSGNTGWIAVIAFTPTATIEIATTTDTLPLKIHKNNAGTGANIVEWWRNGVKRASIDSFGLLAAGSLSGTSYVQTGSGTTRWYAGTGSPEGVVTATVGSLYSRTDGGAGTSLYVKETGSGNTGWAAK